MHYAPFKDTNPESAPGAQRLPAKALLALEILQREPRGLYGLDVVARSDGRLSRASIYIVLGDLEIQGLVSAKRAVEPGWIPRPLYTISAQGLRALAECERNSQQSSPFFVDPAHADTVTQHWTA